MDRKLKPLPQPAVRRTAWAWPVGLLFALCFTTLPLFLALSPGRPTLFDVSRQIDVRVAVHYDDEPKQSSGSPLERESRDRDDILLGGLLSPDFSKSACLSRYLSSMYRAKASSPHAHAPSSYLVSRLRRYEALHRRCGPGTPLYDKSVRQLATAHNSMGLAECRYLVWTPGSHLGDRMVSMASAFLYALLTGRVFLVDMAEDMAGLFCEPFPGASSWELPLRGFPVQNLTQLRRGSEQSYGSLLGAKKIMSGSNHGEDPVRSELLPSYVYLHLAHDYKLPDQLFFCDDHQTVLGKVNWLLLRSDLYFAPGLFLVPQFEDELRWMFPATDTVFHHIGRYLFHPSNTVWEMIQEYHMSYMAKFGEKIGLQITTLAWNPVSTEAYIDQIAACTSQEKILPEVDPKTKVALTSEHEAAATTSKAVLVISAQPEYADRFKSMYHDHATVTGEPVTVLQPPAGAGNQQQKNHKVLVDMFLQSYCDVSVVSGWSTVGYVGHALAGLRPWLLLLPRNQTVPHPPCVRAMSMEPCFHAPPSYDCRAKNDGDLGAVLRYLRRCEDVDDGLKLFD